MKINRYKLYMLHTIDIIKSNQRKYYYVSIETIQTVYLLKNNQLDGMNNIYDQIVVLFDSNGGKVTENTFLLSYIYIYTI